MSLNISGSTITIHNSAGTTKFTSDNKLVYQRSYQTGDVSLSTSSVWVPFVKLQDKDFLVITIKITSATGNPDLTGVLINKEIPANGGVMVDWYARNVNNQPGVDTEILGIDAIESSLVFKTYRLSNWSDLSAGTTTVNLTYYARIWSYL